MKTKAPKYQTFKRWLHTVLKANVSSVRGGQNTIVLADCLICTVCCIAKEDENTEGCPAFRKIEYVANVTGLRLNPM